LLHCSFAVFEGFASLFHFISIFHFRTH